MLRNKKGSLQDLVFVAIVLLSASIVILIGFKITSEYNDQIQGMDTVDAYGKAASTELVGHYPGIIDNSFLLLAIGLCLVTLVLAALVRIHPMFIALFFIGLLIVIFVCGILSNIYQDMASTSALAAQADQLIFISHIMEYLPFIIGIFGFILMIIMYKTWKNATE